MACLRILVEQAKFMVVYAILFGILPALNVSPANNPARTISRKYNSQSIQVKEKTCVRLLILDIFRFVGI